MSRFIASALAVAAFATGAGVASAAPPQALDPIEGQVIWVDFWASWCVPCRRSFPWLNEMQRSTAPRGCKSSE